MSAINGFLDDTVVLPPGEWDRNVLLPILIEQSRAMVRRRKMAKAGKNVTALNYSTFVTLTYFNFLSLNI